MDAGLERDAGSDAGAGTGFDAGADCLAWRRERVRVTSVTLLETMPVHPARSARLLASVEHCPGDEPAVPSYTLDAASKELVLDMTVWRSGAACAAPDVVTRPLTVRFPADGSWTIPTSGEPLVVDVIGAPEVPCYPRPDGCLLDCDCEFGEACLSAEGLGGPFSACARPCELDRDCFGDGLCISISDGLPFVCEASLDECAEPERTCPEGFACEAGRCVATFTLNSATRHECACDADCDAPLRCVMHPGASAGRCEVTCPTEGGWCSGPHTCDASSIESIPGVCAWVGD